MAKELIARHDLKRIAMQELRALPGGDHVIDVEVTYQVDRVLRTNWAMHIFTSDGADMTRIQEAVAATQRRLRQRYDLRTDS